MNLMMTPPRRITQFAANQETMIMNWKPASKSLTEMRMASETSESRKTANAKLDAFLCIEVSQLMVSLIET